MFSGSVCFTEEGMSRRTSANWWKAVFEDGFARRGAGSAGGIGGAAARDHQPQKLKEGDVVLIDGGCAVESYQSDVTRTGSSARHRKKWRAFTKSSAKRRMPLLMRLGWTAIGTVDDVARKVITDAGYGPDYKFFTHRLGHGIGLDGHEHPYLCAEARPCWSRNDLSNEPGIYIPGEFGLRCEDDMVIAAEGRHNF